MGWWQWCRGAASSWVGAEAACTQAQNNCLPAHTLMMLRTAPMLAFSRAASHQPSTIASVTPLRCCCCWAAAGAPAPAHATRCRAGEWLGWRGARRAGTRDRDGTHWAGAG